MTELELLRQRVSKLEGILRFVLSDRLALDKDIQFLDGRNIQSATGTGTMIATANDQKLGFWGTAPVAQPTADTVDATPNTYGTAFFADSSYGNNELNMINAMFQALIGCGLIKEI